MKTVDTNTFAQRSIRAWILMGLPGGGLAFEVWAQSDSQSTFSERIAQTEQLGKQTFKRKNSDVLTFQQIRDLPTNERAIVLDKEMSEVAYEKFDQYMESRTAAAKAEGKRLDKELVESSGRIARHMEALSAKSRKELVAGQKLTISFKSFSQFVTSIDDRVLKAGLSKESADFLKSLLRRPELFAQP